MALQKLIEKYENENKSILNRRPDLTMQGDFTADGIKLFCNNGFIEDLRALAQMPDASENTLPIQNVSQRSELLAFAKEMQKIGFNEMDNAEKVVDIYLKANCG